MNVSDLAPPDATMTTATDPRRCWECAFYSFKVFANEDDTQGKCFRDRDSKNKVWWVDGLNTCPGFKKDPYSPEPVA